MLGELLISISVTLLAYAFYKWATLYNDYFEKRKIKFMKPKFLIGNTGGMFSNQYTATEFSQMLYNTFPNESIFGMFDFRLPQFVVRAPEAIKRIGVKDFDHFEDHRSFADPNIDKLWGNSLFLMQGEKWRHMRATLSPAFTGSKMRQMFELVSECAVDVVNHFSQQAASGQRIDMEMKDFFQRYTNDVIASCAFGISINSFRNPENEFFLSGKSLMNFTGIKALVKIVLINKLPQLAKALKVQISDKKVAANFRSIVLDTMAIRKSENIFRPDMINILMQVRDGSLKAQADEKTKETQEGFATVEESDVGKMAVNRIWTDDELVSQCFLFFVAGFETSATVLQFAAYELVANPDVQQKLTEEILNTNETLNGKRISYDLLQKMTYLDQFICEILRKWPPAVQVDRQCVKDYTYDDGENPAFKVEKGAFFLFPIYGIQHDPNYFPDPEKFDPERFSDENKDSIIPGTYIPFGVGPRNCIGSRFALMQVKSIVYHLLLNFSFEANENTQIPLKLIRSPFSLISEKGVHVQLKPRQH